METNSLIYTRTVLVDIGHHKVSRALSQLCRGRAFASHRGYRGAIFVHLQCKSLKQVVTVPLPNAWQQVRVQFLKKYYLEILIMFKLLQFYNSESFAKLCKVGRFFFHLSNETKK